MKESTIVVKDVRKKYRLFNSASERWKEALHPFSKRYHREFWALNGISFDVTRGETVGILGRNGCGKSTLLQVICGILQPTSGSVVVNGRISSILELGAGLNPEFTGRENVVFQAEVSGLSRKETLRRLPEIEAFADIGQFFDQPVKTYSSGMFVRVAFASATNLDPDILVVDEALAVGDAKFQYRCFQKFREFQARGATILFVSHAAELVIRHCGRALLLEGGRLIADGAPEAVARRYIDLLEERPLDPPSARSEAKAVSAPRAEARQAGKSADAAGEAVAAFLASKPSSDRCAQRASYNRGEHDQRSPRAEIVDYLIVSGNRADISEIVSGDEVDVYVKVQFHARVERPSFGMAIKTKEGLDLYALNSAWTPTESASASAGQFRIARFRATFSFNSGDIFLDFGVDEVNAAPRYANICRRMALAHLKVQCHKLFHGPFDINASFREETVDGRREPEGEVIGLDR